MAAQVQPPTSRRPLQDEDLLISVPVAWAVSTRTRIPSRRGLPGVPQGPAEVPEEGRPVHA